jgi:flavin reductase (DIM6/NTAB) family NADH-FMN oxidoreductase RutF
LVAENFGDIFSGVNIMNKLKKILKRFESLYYSQAYLCLSKESFQFPLRVFLVEKGNVLTEVTDRHAFTGYCPLIFALSSKYSESNSEKIILLFSHHSLPDTASSQSGKTLAKLELKKINSIRTVDGDINFYEGINGKHHFSSFFAQAAGQLYNRIYNRKPGNIFLAGNLYTQVQIAYSVPRKISLITVKEDGLFNLFPTDLHGQLSANYYVISLRHGGMACAQVEASKKIVLSDMNVASFKMVYSLGKNHMQPLKEAPVFPFSARESGAFQLPVPEGSVSYKELQVERSFDTGIHRQFIFRITNLDLVDNSSQTLAHIHNAYATWRFTQGIQNTFFLR